MTAPLPAPHHQSQGGESATGTSGDGAAASGLTGADSTSATLALGKRALANTLSRSGSEVVGRLASLALFVEAGRTVGQSGLGAFVFAVAFLGFVMVAVDLGLDRWMLRAIARERTARDRAFFNVLTLKLALALPLIGAGLGSANPGPA